MKYFIYYSNGYFEAVDKLNMTLIHLVEIGAAKFILDVEASGIYVSTGDGSHKKIKVTQVSGLS